MTASATDVNERQLTRWGGFAGFVGGLLLLGAFLVVGAVGLPDTSNLDSLTDFPDIETARIVENALYLGALVMFALHSLALSRMLWSTNPAPALFGAATSVLGLVTLIAGALLHVTTATMSDLYVASDTSASERQTIAYVWQGAQSVFDTLLITGALLVAVGILLFGLAMRSSATFGPVISWVSIGLGSLGIVGAAVGVVDPGSPAVAGSILGLLVFHLCTGWLSLRRS
jgi:magnesium-transporting ATPase (P-type)